MLKLIFLTLTLLTFTCVHGVVIVVHGSFASTTSWPQPGGDFFKALESQARYLEQHVVTCCWSGIPTDQEIIKGGTLLAQLVMSYSATEKIILIGHSHGGNVINVASQLLYKVTHQETQELQTHVNPIVLEVPILITTPCFQLLETTKTSSQAANSNFQGQSFQNLITCAVAELKRWRSKFLTKANATPCIEFSYLLGTPADMTKFWPHMEIIKQMILFHSDGDFVQPVLGLFEKTYPAHSHRANVKVKLHTSSHGSKAPSHADLHHQIIGKWLLCIPEILAQLKVGNFEKFNFRANGAINFYADQAPRYDA